MKSLLLVLLCGFSILLHAQSGLVIDANAAAGNQRILLSLSNISNSTNSLAQLLLKSGDGANVALSDLTTYSKTYTASPGYIGYTSLTNNASGLIFRTTEASSDIRFLTAGGVLATNTRMIINSAGSIGIGTDTPATKLQIAAGDVYIQDINQGVIFKTGSGANDCYRLTVTNVGAVSTAQVTCPN